MQTFLEAFAKTIAMDEHVALVLDGAGWHSGKTLRVPRNITLVPLPPYSHELNPVERVWLALSQAALLIAAASQRLHGGRRCRLESLEMPTKDVGDIPILLTMILAEFIAETACEDCRDSVIGQVIRLLIESVAEYRAEETDDDEIATCH